MTKAYEYKIISGNADEVERQVEDYTCQGWKLHGGLCMSYISVGCIFAQAVIREVEQPGPWG